MKPLGLGEHGDVFYVASATGWTAMVYYRDFSGVKRRLKASGSSKAEARRQITRSLERALKVGRDGEFSARSTLADGTESWLRMVEGLVNRGTRSPSTLVLYRETVNRYVLKGVGGLRLGEVSTARLDRFLQAVLADKGYATAKLCRTVLSGTCGYLVRQDALAFNPVRDVTPLEAGRPPTARALSAKQVRALLEMLDNDPVAIRKDLPELARFMLATGLRIGEALGVQWSDVDLIQGVVDVGRTVGRIKGKGLHAGRLKSRASYRVLLLPHWCVVMLKARRVTHGAFEGPLFPDSRGGYRDVSNTANAFRTVRTGSSFEWVTSHTFRKTVATFLDESGSSARLIADQLGHARISMTQDVYMGRHAVDGSVANALDGLNPDDATDPDSERGEVS